MNKQPYSWQQKVQGGVRWDREKLPQPNLHVYGENGTKTMVYNVRRCQKERGSKNLERKRLRNTTQKEEVQILNQTVQPMLSMIFISYTYNFSSKPSTIITSFLKSGQFFLSYSTNLLFGLVGPKPNPVLGSKPKLVLTIYIYICVCVCVCVCVQLKR